MTRLPPRRTSARAGRVVNCFAFSPLRGPRPFGSGKTSLLLLGLMRPERGYIALGEEVLFDSSAGVDLSPEERGLGYVPQEYALFPHLDVFENVAFGLTSLPA